MFHDNVKFKENNVLYIPILFGIFGSIKLRTTHIFINKIIKMYVSPQQY